MTKTSNARAMFSYNDWADLQLLGAARLLSDAQLDQGFDIGLGTLRRTLKHILDGETVWLARWQGKAETPWPDYETSISVAEMERGFAAAWRERDSFLGRVDADAMARTIVYRDSKGSLFQATLAQMMMQMFVHSTHHRAQAANILRRLGAGLVELDYMMSIRRPA